MFDSSPKKFNLKLMIQKVIKNSHCATYQNASLIYLLNLLKFILSFLNNFKVSKTY